MKLIYLHIVQKSTQNGKYRFKYIFCTKSTLYNLSTTRYRRKLEYSLRGIATTNNTSYTGYNWKSLRRSLKHK